MIYLLIVIENVPSVLKARSEMLFLTIAFFPRNIDYSNIQIALATNIQNYKTAFLKPFMSCHGLKSLYERPLSFVTGFPGFFIQDLFKKQNAKSL